MLKLGYKASAEQFGPTELLQFSRLAEEAGFDSVFISDHFQPWKHHGGHAPFSLAWLGALGAVTSRITIGTSVLTPTFRYQPAVVAQAFATLGVMFPNRVVLGVGTGESLNDVPSTGMDMARFQGAVRAFPRGDHLDPSALDRGAGDVRRPILSHQGRDHLRSARDARTDLCRGGRRIDREICGTNGRRLDLHQRQGARALHRNDLAESVGRARRGWLASA